MTKTRPKLKIQNYTESRTWIQEKVKRKKKKLEIHVDRLSTIANQARPEDDAVELIAIFKLSLQSERD